MLRVFLRCTIIVVILFCAVCRSQAQDALDRDFSDFSGLRDSDQLLNRDNPLATEAKIRGGTARQTPSDSFYFLPSVLDSPHVVSGGFALAYTKNNAFQDLDHYLTQFKVAVPNLVTGRDRRNKYGVEGKVVLLRDDPLREYKPGYRLTLIAGYTHTQLSTDTYAVSLAGSKQLGKLWSIAANAGFAEKEAFKAHGQRAIKTAAGIDYVINAHMDVSLDYTFDNAIDKQDNYSVTLAMNIPHTRSLAFFSVAKGGVLSASMSVPFH